MIRNELKIGNHINAILNTTDGPLKTMIIIDCLHRNTIETIGGQTWPYNQLEGIPIDDYWMNELGFTKYDECFWRIKKSDGWFLNKEGEVTKSISEFFIRCRFVHELQNFIFILSSSKILR